MTEHGRQSVDLSSSNFYNRVMRTPKPGSIVVLGTDPFIIDACRERGHHAVVVRDVHAHLRGDNLLPPGSVEVVVGDVSDIGDVMAGLIRVGGGRIPDDLIGVATANEFAVATQTWLTSELGLPGPTMASTVLMRDKHAQKAAVRAAGVATAAARFCVAGSDLHQAPYQGPCVVKPAAGAGADQTYKCTSEAAYNALMRRLAPRAGTPLVVEDLVDVGEEWVVDGVMQQARMVFSSVGRYAEPALDYTSDAEIEVGDNALRLYRLDGHGDETSCDAARQVAGRALAALGYTEGVFHLELLRERGTGEFLFGECAARRGGGMIQEEVAFKHGFSLAGAAIDISLRRAVREPGPISDRFVATTYLYLPSGTILSVAEPGHLQELGFVHDVHISALVGPNTPPANMTTSYRQGMCVVSGGSSAELEENMARARQRFRECSHVAPTNGTKAEIRTFMAAQRKAGLLVLGLDG